MIPVTCRYAGIDRGRYCASPKTNPKEDAMLDPIIALAVKIVCLITFGSWCIAFGIAAIKEETGPMSLFFGLLTVVTTLFTVLIFLA